MKESTFFREKDTINDIVLPGTFSIIILSILFRMYDNLWKNKLIETLFEISENISDQDFTYDKIIDLPKPMKRYFKYALSENQSYISYLRLKHTGFFKIFPDQDWKPIQGEEYFTTQKPGFVWFGKLKSFVATDLYVNGEDNLKVKLFSMIPIVDEKGATITQGEMLRWLGEAPWYPTALLPSDKIRWESIDDQSAKVILKDGNLTGEGVFHFNEKGQMIKFSAKRYYEDQLEDLTGFYDDYKNVNGMNIPSKVRVEWNLDSGNYSYAKFNVQTFEFNIPSKFN